MIRTKLVDLPGNIEEQTECLTRAIFFEARGENFTGQKFVGFVIKNRVLNDRYPDGFCSVINQPNQFSFKFKSRTYYSAKRARNSAYHAAKQVIEAEKSPLPHNVLYFTNRNVVPSWNSRYIKAYMTYGNHTFYKHVK